MQIKYQIKIWALLGITVVMGSCAYLSYDRFQSEENRSTAFQCSGLHTNKGEWEFVDGYGQTVTAKGRCSRGMRHGRFVFYVEGKKIAQTTFFKGVEKETQCYTGVSYAGASDLRNCLKMSVEGGGNSQEKLVEEGMDFRGDEKKDIIHQDTTKENLENCVNRSEYLKYLKERHHCIELFRKSYAPERQPKDGLIAFNDENVNDCFAELKSNYPELHEYGQCKSELEKIEANFQDYVRKCIHQSDFTECEKALKNVKSVDNIRYTNGATLLMAAAQESDVKAMEFLIKKGASAKKVDHMARNLLRYAFAKRKNHELRNPDEIRLKVVKKILDLGVHPQEPDLYGQTVFCGALYGREPAGVVELLINAGTNVNLRCQNQVSTLSLEAIPLGIVATFGDFENVQLLLNAGAHPDSALSVAIHGGNEKIVKVLVDAGANVNAVSSTTGGVGFSMLELAERLAETQGKECGKCQNVECSNKCEKDYKRRTDIVAILKKAGAKKISADDLIDYRDGRLYKTVKIGNQIWMAENLNYKSNKSRCSENKDENCKKYGRLYPVFREGNVCPSGWRVPAIKDWYQLFANIGVKKKNENCGYNCDYLVWDYAGNKLNEKGFNILLGGDGLGGIGTQADFAALRGSMKSESRFPSVDLEFCFKYKSKKNFQASDYCHQDTDGMYSVRCVRDNQEEKMNNEMNIKKAKQEALDILKHYRYNQEAYYFEVGKAGSLQEIGFIYLLFGRSFTFFDYTEQKDKGMYISPKKSLGSCTTRKKISISPIFKKKGKDSVIHKFKCKIDPGCEMFASSIKSVCE